MAEFAFSELSDTYLGLLFQSCYPLQDTPISSKTKLDVTESLDSIFDQQEHIDPDGNVYADLNNSCVYSEMEKLSSELSNITLNSIEITARSLQKNFDSILMYFDPIIDKLECILITETWFTRDTADQFSIAGFGAMHIFRKRKRGGGISIYVRSKTVYSSIKKFNIISNDYEFQFIKISTKIHQS